MRDMSISDVPVVGECHRGGSEGRGSGPESVDTETFRLQRLPRVSINNLLLNSVSLRMPGSAMSRSTSSCRSLIAWRTPAIARCRSWRTL